MKPPLAHKKQSMNIFCRRLSFGRPFVLPRLQFVSVYGEDPFFISSYKSKRLIGFPDLVAAFCGQGHKGPEGTA